MRNFIELDCAIINLNEIMYINAEYDENYNIDCYHIVMKDQHHFVLPNTDETQRIIFLIKNWTGAISTND